MLFGTKRYMQEILEQWEMRLELYLLSGASFGFTLKLSNQNWTKKSPCLGEKTKFSHFFTSFLIQKGTCRYYWNYEQWVLSVIGRVEHFLVLHLSSKINIERRKTPFLGGKTHFSHFFTCFLIQKGTCRYYWNHEQWVLSSTRRKKTTFRFTLELWNQNWTKKLRF